MSRLPPIAAGIVGLEVGPVTRAIDARWLMAYAAALGERDPRYFDTAAPGGPVAHPLFPVCYEWPLMLAIRDAALDPATHVRGVHAAHRVALHRLPRAGEALTTTARVAAVERRRAGTRVTVRLVSVDATGAPVSTTDYDSLYRDVELVGADGRPVEPVGPPGDGRGGGAAPAAAWSGTGWEEVVDIAATAAHVYTECARIWNPIHTDIAVARAAGLPGLVLHGTATLALAVSRVVARDLGGDATRVRSVSARFTGMVILPSRFTVRRGPSRGDAIAFDAVGAGGRPVLSDGALAR